MKLNIRTFLSRLLDFSQQITTGEVSQFEGQRRQHGRQKPLVSRCNVGPARCFGVKLVV